MVYTHGVLFCSDWVSWRTWSTLIGQTGRPAGHSNPLICVPSTGVQAQTAMLGFYYVDDDHGLSWSSTGLLLTRAMEEPGFKVSTPRAQSVLRSP